jgi:CSLREA domain-containing protein
MFAKKSISRIFSVWFVVVFMLALWLAPAHKVHAAAALTVNTLADNETNDGLCTLREAIIAANTNADYRGCAATGYGDDTITFSVSGTIVLGSYLPGVTATATGGALTMDGAGQSITVSGNNAVSAFAVLADAALTLQNLTVANADSIGGGGGVWSNGTLTVANCIFSNNHADQGGGISAIGGTLTVTGSTFSGNSADTLGGGIFNNGTLTVTNSTFSGNSATQGGSIFNGNTLTVINSTFSGNSANTNGGGIYSFGSATLRNSIVANGTAGGNCHGTITNGGNNIDDGTTCSWGSANGSMSSTNPLLGVLANNGGSTQTFALLTGSPAIDGGDDSHCPATDQRGLSRPQGAHCDIGAFEVKIHSIYLPLVMEH